MQLDKLCRQEFEEASSYTLVLDRAFAFRYGDVVTRTVFDNGDGAGMPPEAAGVSIWAGEVVSLEDGQVRVAWLGSDDGASTVELLVAPDTISALVHDYADQGAAGTAPASGSPIPATEVLPSGPVVQTLRDGVIVYTDSYGSYHANENADGFCYDGDYEGAGATYYPGVLVVDDEGFPVSINVHYTNVAAPAQASSNPGPGSDPAGDPADFSDDEAANP